MGGWGETHKRGQGWGVGKIRQRQGFISTSSPRPAPTSPLSPAPTSLPLTLGHSTCPTPLPTAHTSPGRLPAHDVCPTLWRSSRRFDPLPRQPSRSSPRCPPYAGPCAPGCHPACCWRALRHPNDQCRSDRPTSLAAGAPTMISLPSSIAIAACAVACHGMLIVTCVLI